MNKETKFFLLFIIFVTLVVVIHRYDEYIINRNFILDVDSACDPTSESCFVADCSPIDDSTCDDTPYKKVKILDSVAPKCLEEHSCSNFLCSNNNNCSVIYCSKNNLNSGEKCTELLTQKN